MAEVTSWHHRFETQAGWTAQLRAYLTARLKFPGLGRILEVGCGTGALFPDISARFPQSKLFGLDINPDFLRYCQQKYSVSLCGGDGHYLPYRSSSFDLVYCHYFLLWIQEKPVVLGEITRVLRPGGTLILFAEPDYGGRVDYPPPLNRLGGYQISALESQGADPYTGRQIPALLANLGYQSIHWGVLGAEFAADSQPVDPDSEWWVIREDLAGKIEAKYLDEIEKADRLAWEVGQRVLFVPTFYALGIKPDED
jgi:SAM-dependent methyltransferase